jgi:ribosomal protein L11 methyltransferase
VSGESKGRLWRIEVNVSPGSVPLFERALERFVQAITIDGEPRGELVRIEGIADSPPDANALFLALHLAAAGSSSPMPQPLTVPLADADWLSESLKYQTPVFAGRYVAHGSHLKSAVPPGRIGLEVDAGLAFGTGAHESTCACLIALDWLARRWRPGRVRAALDMGCGSGILTVAMAKTWSAPVVACDIDPVAVGATRVTATANGVGRLIRAIESDGYRSRRLRRHGGYDLVCANILAEPLCRMAPDLRRHLARGGVAVLSGFLARKQAEVLNAHRAQGFRLVRRIALGGWRAFVVRR